MTAEHDLGRLMSTGFPREACEAALRKYNHNHDAALYALLMRLQPERSDSDEE